MKFYWLLSFVWLTGCTVTTADSFTQAQTTIQFSNAAQTQVQVYVADTPAEWKTGLGNISALAANEGMLFIFPTPGEYSFWMKDVEYPLDLIWLLDDTIVAITPHIQPQPQTTLYYPPTPVNQVIEVPAGFIAEHDITVEQGLTIMAK